MNSFLLLIPLITLLKTAYSTDTINTNIILSNVDRSVDAKTQILKTTSKFTILNNGPQPVSFILYSVEPELGKHLSYISASTQDGRVQLKVVASKVQGHEDKEFLRISLREDLQSKKSVVIEVEAYFTESINPYPVSIRQKEKQLMRFNASSVLYSPYTVQKQSLTVITGAKTLESYTKVKPVTFSDGNIAYGPYENTKPFTYDRIVVHYENNSPFLSVTLLERVIEISHWGNVAVEEIINIEHKGAVLKGPFSRYDYQRESQTSGVSSVKSYKTILPASAKDTYYRDDIGNISTSHLRYLTDSVELDLRPRFPLFGGWKNKYIIGYNLPSYEYLFNSGDSYLLKMRVIDHVLDDMVVEELITKVVLPEGADNIRLKTPYSVTRLNDEIHYSYLDVTGRKVIVFTKKNLIENHIQDFELSYTFPKILMLREPLLAGAAAFTLFLTIIAYIRFDAYFLNPKTED